MKELLFDLCKLSGISGNENSVSQYLAEHLRKYTDDVKIDFNNNVTAVLGNKNADYTFLLDAHIDQIGFIVTEIDDKGFLKVDKVGGVDLRTALDSPVIVHGKRDLNGIICCMPPHLSDGNEDKAISIDKVFIDLGLPYDDVKKLVKVGDSVTFFANPKELLGNKISAVALDNRAGAATLLYTAKLISESDVPYKVVILLSCQEETFATGAKTVPFDFDINECVSVDVSFANQPGIDNQYSNIKLGKGAMLCISPNLNREMFNKFKQYAEDNKINYQLEICNGRTGTNSDHIAVSKSGVKTALVSIPQKNMHTQAEIIDINDIISTAELISGYISNGGVK